MERVDREAKYIARRFTPVAVVERRKLPNADAELTQPLPQCAAGGNRRMHAPATPNQPGNQIDQTLLSAGCAAELVNQENLHTATRAPQLPTPRSTAAVHAST